MNNILENDGIYDECLTGILAWSVASVGTLTSKLYLQSVNNTISKFLISKGVLNFENVGKTVIFWIQLAIILRTFIHHYVSCTHVNLYRNKC